VNFDVFFLTFTTFHKSIRLKVNHVTWFDVNRTLLTGKFSVKGYQVRLVQFYSNAILINCECKRRPSRVDSLLR